MDQKNDPGASDVFRKVLALDPENVLALKILADIAERGHRYGEAVEWLTRLLSADPMNGEAAEALTRARGRAAQSDRKSTRLNSSHRCISYAVFCLKKKKKKKRILIKKKHQQEQKKQTTIEKQKNRRQKTSITEQM